MSLADSIIFGCRAPSIMHFIVALSKIGPPDLNPLTYRIGGLSVSSPCTVTLEKNQLNKYQLFDILITQCDINSYFISILISNLP